MVCPVACRHTTGTALRVVLNDVGALLDDRLHADLPGRYARHNAQTAGPDKPSIDVTVHADTRAQALLWAGVAAAAICELAESAQAGLDFRQAAFVVREQVLARPEVAS
jgi:hypothetical protein